MSLWQLGTCVAIVCLTVGAIAVFGWFLRDAVALFRERTRRP